MKILLIKSASSLKTIRKLGTLILLEPLELCYLAAAVPPPHTVEILDLRIKRFPARALRRTLQRMQPGIVGLSAYTHEVTNVASLAARIRADAPEALIVVGGHHATVLPADFNRPEFDAVVRSEGCGPFREIVARHASGADLDGIENVMIPGGEWDGRAADTLPSYPEPDSLPFPRRDLCDSQHYRCIWPSQKHPDWETIFPETALLRTSFGCCMNCSFCVVPKLSRHRHMTRDSAKIVEELAQIPQKHVYLCDDETFLNPEHARDVANAIAASGIDKRYFAWARSSTVNRYPELFRTWRGIGLDCVFLGMEAASDQQLEQMNKHSSVVENETAHRTLLEMDISVQAAFMVDAGYGEEDFARLQTYLSELPPAQVTCTVYTPSPGSDAWQREKENYVCHPNNLHDCMHPLVQTRLPLKRFFRHFSQTAVIGGRRNPLRSLSARMPPRDIFRIVRAVSQYSRALKKAWRDY